MKDWKKELEIYKTNMGGLYGDSGWTANFYPAEVVESLLSEQEAEWKQNGGLRLRGTERSILAHLLEEHIESGSYFGRKDQHYKMCKELMTKLVAEKK